MDSSNSTTSDSEHNDPTLHPTLPTSPVPTSPAPEPPVPLPRPESAFMLDDLPSPPITPPPRAPSIPILSTYLQNGHTNGNGTPNSPRPSSPSKQTSSDSHSLSASQHSTPPTSVEVFPLSASGPGSPPSRQSSLPYASQTLPKELRKSKHASQANVHSRSRTLSTPLLDTTTTAQSPTRTTTTDEPFSHSSPPPIVHASLTASRNKSLGSKFQALRKKIESELSRKRTTSSSHKRSDTHTPSRQQRKQKHAPGTVAGLKPTPALTVPEGMSVADASQLCAAKRTDCVLVVDDEEHLSGIFTAKDLAFRVVAEGLEPRSTLVSAIMTRNPMVTRDTTSATEALQLMVSRAFRHLPVCNDEGDVVGLLDITKVFNEALDKIERGHGASQKLYTALEGVQTELGGTAHNPQAAAMVAYVEALREKMALPDLQSVMDTRTQPAMVSVKTSVRDAARIMKEHRTTAVCVMEPNREPGAGAGVQKIAGIFTSKDIVLRVIAAGLQPDRCSVVRVMTPHPDRAPPSMTIQEALRKMYNGHYLNMPVVDHDGRLVAIIDVLKLTYATLEQINSMSTDMDQEEGGPMWGRFFGSIATAPVGEDSESVVSGSLSRTGDFPTSPRGGALDRDERIQSMSEVHPNDSASAVGAATDDPSNLGVAPSSLAARGSGAAATPIVDENIAVFKFVSPAQRIHRFESPTLSLDHLRDIVAGKLLTDPFFNKPTEEYGDGPVPDPNDFTLAYTDDDGDLVMMSADSDVKDAVYVAQKQKQSRILLVVSGGKGWSGPVVAAPFSAPSASAAPTSAPAAVKALERLEEELEEQAAEEAPLPKAVDGEGADVVDPKRAPEEFRKLQHAGDDVVFGIPRDLVLPAAIAFTGVVVVAVFIGSRLGGRK